MKKSLEVNLNFKLENHKGSLGVHPGNSGQFSKSSSGCTTASSGASTEIQQINNQPTNSEYQDESMRKVRFDKVYFF